MPTTSASARHRPDTAPPPRPPSWPATPRCTLLALTHLSTRYGGRELRDEARAIFPASEVPRDFDTIEVPLPERGGPELVRWREPVRA